MEEGDKMEGRNYATLVSVSSPRQLDSNSLIFDQRLDRLTGWRINCFSDFNFSKSSSREVAMSMSLLEVRIRSTGLSIITTHRLIFRQIFSSSVLGITSPEEWRMVTAL
jgi:hypothetical protein